MKKKFKKLFILFSSVFLLSFGITYAYEDCIITTNGRLTDIKIQHHDIIDVYPLVTIMNDKNTLFVQPLKTGETKFSVLKDKKEKIIFDVKVTKNKTEIKDVSGFDIFTFDCPPDMYEYYFDLDEPPTAENEIDIDEPPFIENKTEMNQRIEEAKQYQEYIDTLEAPLRLRGEE